MCLRTKYCRLYEKLRRLNFVFPAENEALVPVLLGLKASSSSSIASSIIKFPSVKLKLL